MKTFRATSGPFAERPFYELKEIERICTEELHAAELYPSRPEPIRVERFIEKRFHISPTYEELPHGVLGYTRFNRDGVEAIVVSSAFHHTDGPDAPSALPASSRTLPSESPVYRSLARALIERDAQAFAPGTSNVDLDRDGPARGDA